MFIVTCHLVLSGLSAKEEKQEKAFFFVDLAIRTLASSRQQGWPSPVNLPVPAGSSYTTVRRLYILGSLVSTWIPGDRRHLAYARCPSDEVALSVSSSDDCCCCNWQCDG